MANTSVRILFSICSVCLWMCFTACNNTASTAISFEKACSIFENTLNYTGCTQKLTRCTGSEIMAIALGGGEALPCDTASLQARNVSGEACTTPSGVCTSDYNAYKSTQKAAQPVAYCAEAGTFLTTTHNTDTNTTETTCAGADASRRHCQGACSCPAPFTGPQCDVLTVQNSTEFPPLSNGHFFSSNTEWKSRIVLPSPGLNNLFAVVLPWFDVVVTPNSDQQFNLGTPLLEWTAVFDDNTTETFYKYTYHPVSHEETRSTSAVTKDNTPWMEHTFQNAHNKRLTAIEIHAVHTDIISSSFNPKALLPDTDALLQIRLISNPYAPKGCNGLTNAYYPGCPPLSQYCGDSVVQPGEACDHGAQINGRSGNACASNCQYTCTKRYKRMVFTLSQPNNTALPTQVGSVVYSSRFVYRLDYAPREWADNTSHPQNTPETIAWNYLYGYGEPYTRSCNGKGEGQRKKTLNRCLYAVEKWFLPTEQVWGQNNKVVSQNDFSIFAKADNHLSFMLLGPNTSLSTFKPTVSAYLGIQNTCGTIYQKTDTMTLTHDEVCAPITP